MFFPLYRISLLQLFLLEKLKLIAFEKNSL